jgi:hypothetical protein
MGPWAILALFGIGALVWKGQQYILRQESHAVWFSDPYQYDSDGNPGSGLFYVGELPPGEAPPWRLASELEIVQMEQLEAGF